MQKIIVSCLILVLLAEMPAQAQVTSTTPFALTNLPTVITGGSTSNITTQSWDVWRDRGFGFTPVFNGTNAASTNAITFYFELASDGTGTNYSNSGTVNQTFYMNGTNLVRGWANIPPLLINNAQKVTLTKIVSTAASTNALSLSGITITR